MLPVSIFSQVSVGSTNPPEKAALLDIKTLDIKNTSPLEPTTDNMGGGLLLPRVILTAKSSPFFISNDDPKLDVKKKRITGMLVYNLKNTSDGLTSGVCIWDGSEWKNIASSSSAQQQSWLISGNAGTDINNNFVGTKDSKPLSVKTNNTDRIYIAENGKVGLGSKQPKTTLHVVGNMILNRPLTFQKGTQTNILAINNDGKIGTAASIPSRIMFAESSVAQPITGSQINSFNNAMDIVVTWTENDIVTNNIVEFDKGENAFKFKETTLCEISGYIIYQPDATTSYTYSVDFNNTGAALNVILQYWVPAEHRWENFTAARAIWVGASVSGVPKSIDIPPAIKTFNKDDKIRMVMKRPSEIFGLEHHKTGTGGIRGSTNTSKLKGLKITAM